MGSRKEYHPLCVLHTVCHCNGQQKGISSAMCFTPVHTVWLITPNGGCLLDFAKKTCLYTCRAAREINRRAPQLLHPRTARVLETILYYYYCYYYFHYCNAVHMIDHHSCGLCTYIGFGCHGNSTPGKAVSHDPNFFKYPLYLCPESNKWSVRIKKIYYHQTWNRNFTLLYKYMQTPQQLHVMFCFLTPAKKPDDWCYCQTECYQMKPDTNWLHTPVSSVQNFQPIHRSRKCRFSKEILDGYIRSKITSCVAICKWKEILLTCM